MKNKSVMFIKWIVSKIQKLSMPKRIFLSILTLYLILLSPFFFKKTVKKENAPLAERILLRPKAPKPKTVIKKVNRKKNTRQNKKLLQKKKGGLPVQRNHKTKSKKPIKSRSFAKTIAEIPPSYDKVDQSSLNTLSKEKEMSYSSCLALLFERALSLPEKGDVKIELVIDKKGKIISMNVLLSESVKNQEYLLQEVPKIALPRPHKGNQFSQIFSFSGDSL